MKPHYCVSSGCPEGYVVEFRNGNTLDCRSSNLRYIPIKDIPKGCQIDYLPDLDEEEEPEDQLIFRDQPEADHILSYYDQQMKGKK